MMDLINLDVPVERDELGYWSNPDIPDFDEDNVAYGNWLAEQGLELDIESLDDELESHPAYQKYFEDGDPDIRDWVKDPPKGDGWKTFSIHDTDDGPVWIWARRI